MCNGTSFNLEKFPPLAGLELETAHLEINFELTYLTSSVDDADGASVAGVVEVEEEEDQEQQSQQGEN